jgi:hypothetical protein
VKPSPEFIAQLEAASVAENEVQREMDDLWAEFERQWRTDGQRIMALINEVKPRLDEAQRRSNALTQELIDMLQASLRDEPEPG